MTTSALQCSKRDIWLIRVYYFLFFGAFGFNLPFLNLYYDRAGITAEQIGIFATINAVVGLVVSPFIGSLISKNSRQIRLSQFGLLASGLVMILIGLSSKMVPFAIFSGLFSLGFAGVFPASISIAQTIVRCAPGNAGFGSIRLFGSIGWAVVTYGAGLMIEQVGLTVIFIGYVLFVVLAAVVIGLIRLPDGPDDGPGKIPDVKLREVTGKLLRNRGLVGFAAAVLFIQFALIGIRQFESLFMDDLGATESIIGLAFTIAAVIEIPFMLIADKIIQRFNTTNVLLVGFFLDLIRMVIVLLVPTVPLIIFARAVTGISYSFVAIGSAEFVQERAAEGHNVTLQALYTVTFPNLISVFASPLIGGLFDTRGGLVIYQVGAAGMALAIAVFLATGRVKSSRVMAEG